MLPSRVFPSPVYRSSTGTFLCGTCSGFLHLPQEPAHASVGQGGGRAGSGPGGSRDPSTSCVGPC